MTLDASSPTDYNAETALKAVRRIEFINSLVRCGETPDEIEVEVHFLADFLEKLFISWMGQQDFVARHVEEGLFVKPFLRWVYLCHYPRKCYLHKVSKKMKQNFVEVAASEIGIKDNLFKVILLDSIERFEKFLSDLRNLIHQ